MSNPGISKHDISSFNESDAINLLSNTLESNHTIKTFFSENDRTPNHDGFFELVDEEYTPKKQFIVQIKKVENLEPNTKGINKGKYVYNKLKTNFLYYVKKKVTENPAIYFVVDIVTKRIFWIYLSDELLMSLNFEGHTTISFPFDENNILYDINHFTTILNQISTERNSLFVNKSQEEIIELQDALDYINQLFDHDFYNIKKALFPHLWRFGIRASNDPVTIEMNGKASNPLDSSVFALYPQIKGTVDTGIREFTLENTNYNNSICIGGRIPPMKYAEESVHKALKYFFESGIPANYLPNIVLQEKAWTFVEKTNSFFNDSTTDKLITIKVLELRYHLLLKYIDKILYSDNLTTAEIKLKSNLINQFQRAWNSIDISSILSYGVKESFEKFCRKEYHSPFPIHTFVQKIINRDSLELQLLIDEIKKRNIKEVSSVWKYEWYTLRQMEKDQFLCCINDITSEWLTNLPILYNETYEKLFETTSYKFKNEIVYKNYFPEMLFGINRFSTLIHKYKNKPFSIHRDDGINKDFTEQLKQNGLTNIIDTGSLDSFLDHKLLYFESLNCLVYKGICEKLGYKPKNLHIGSEPFTIGLDLF